MTDDARDSLNAALDNIRHLENGLVLCCAAVQDPDQRQELLRAKRNILEALQQVAAGDENQNHDV